VHKPLDPSTTVRQFGARTIRLGQLMLTEAGEWSRIAQATGGSLRRPPAPPEVDFTRKGAGNPSRKISGPYGTKVEGRPLRSAATGREATGGLPKERAGRRPIVCKSFWGALEGPMGKGLGPGFFQGREGPQMLVLSRRRGEAVVIADGIRVSIVSISRSRVRLAIEAPMDIAVDREEIYRAKREGDWGAGRELQPY
jgi:carbon storage regulator